MTSGTLDAEGNYVFDVTAFTFNNGSTLTINGDAAGNAVVFNFSPSQVNNPQFGGTIVLNGLSPDQVLFNVTGSNSAVADRDQSSHGPGGLPGSQRSHLGRQRHRGRPHLRRRFA